MLTLTVRAVRLLSAVLAVLLMTLASAVPACAQTVFSVFANDPIQWGVVGIAFAGDKFVFSVQTDGHILYSTDLNGKNLQPFAPSISISGGNAATNWEHPLASSLGLAGFPSRDIYVGTENGIIHITHDGSRSDMYATGLNGTVRALLFDAVGTFGHDLLATTENGSVYRIDRLGNPKLLAVTGDDPEGMDIAPIGAGFGPYDGQLITISTDTGWIHAISPTGTVAVLNTNFQLFDAEDISFVPLNMGASHNPVEGFYVANAPGNIVKADTSQFTSYMGDAIIAIEFPFGPIWRMHWNGTGFDYSLIGSLTGQAEEAIFVTPALVNLGGSCPTDPNRDRDENAWCAPFCQKPHGKRLDRD
jgi:hypothetical protein